MTRREHKHLTSPKAEPLGEQTTGLGFDLREPAAR